jgi:hypothetical protein
MSVERPSAERPPRQRHADSQPENIRGDPQDLVGNRSALRHGSSIGRVCRFPEPPTGTDMTSRAHATVARAPGRATNIPMMPTYRLSDGSVRAGRRGRRGHDRVQSFALVAE